MAVRRGAMNDGWSKTGTLTTGRPKPGGLSMQASFEEASGGSGAQYYTVQFGVRNPPVTGIFDAVAEIIWSTQGTDVRRLVSVGNGVSVSGTAQACKVDVVDRTNIVLFPPPFTPNEYRVDILITPGCRPSVEMPPRLFPESLVGPPAAVNGVVSLAPATSQDFSVPQNAGIISYKVEVFSLIPLIGADSSVLSILGGAPVGAIDPFHAKGWNPMVPGTTILRLFNLTVAKDIVFNVVYGIEG